jgi:hypothetical protein
MAARGSILICLPRGIFCAQLPVDLDVLCDLVERLTGLYVMSYKVNTQWRTLHEVVLPRSWFINFILPGTKLEKDTSYISDFTSIVVEFMHQIDAQVQRYPTVTSTSKRRFSTDGSRVTNLTGPLYIARM